MKKIYLSILFLCSMATGSTLHAQESNALLTGGDIADPLEIANEYIHSHLEELGLTLQDVAEMTISDMYTDKTTGITRLYLLQHYHGIPVYNAILNISITKEGKVFFVGNRFEKDLSGRINASSPVLKANEAVRILADHLGLTEEEPLMLRQSDDSHYLFDKGRMAKENITAQLSYQPYNGKILLAWDIFISPIDNDDTWSTRIDAISGEVLNQINRTSYCFKQSNTVSYDDDFINETAKVTHTNINTSLLNASITGPSLTGAQYNVWPAPLQSPDQGPRSLVTDPFDPVASPFGWHDINGQPGPEYTITRGNNVHAYQDRDLLGHSSNDEPDGGPALHFDFPFDTLWDPEQYVDASVVNLFYRTNYLHDYFYHFGFDEEAGNFQKNNYGKGGTGNDPLIAKTQEGANKGKSNYAYMYTSPDGSSPALHLYVFNRKKKFLTVNTPAFVAGKYETSLPKPGWGAGAYLTDVPLTGEVVIVDDGIEDPYTSDACEPIINATEVAGKIALIDRGGCQFGTKALLAQQAGAIAVVICNYDDNTYNLEPGLDGPDVNIPIVLIHLKDAQAIRQFAGNGLTITLVNPGQNDMSPLDSGLDNGLITHEYGHGISNRLVGGPSQICMGNDEQMGEGWSDFLTLVTFVKPGDSGDMKRGFATYLFEESSTEKGYRRYPYSTDMNINPLTYGDVAASQEEHDLGEVWASMLWDMYWALVERYGWSPDPFDTSSGHYKAVRLVFDGMKNIPCSPGFVDGRNAILAADEVLYNGENACMLWEVFARRGLGYSADQGSPFDAGDQTEAFDLPPLCTNKIIIEKSVTDFIQPGDDIEVTIKVGNYKPETVTNVMVYDEISEETFFKPNSSNLPATVQGNTISFSLGEMSFTEEATITYTLTTDPNAWSKRIFLDDVPDQNNTNWHVQSICADASNTWSITDEYPAHSGQYSWKAKDNQERCRQSLTLQSDIYDLQVGGENPALRFYHRYLTKGGQNGGIVEVREVGNKWHTVEHNMLRNGYKSKISYNAFALPDARAFSGNSGLEYKASYINLSEWAGRHIQIRFRFGSTANTSVGFGWLIDDIEYMDLLNYNSEACVSTDQGDYECAIAPESGTIVESKEETVSVPESMKDLSAIIYPNPASDMITIALYDENEKDITIRFTSVDGKQLYTESFTISGNDHFNIDTHDMPAGLYLVKIDSAEDRFIGKVIIRD